MSEPLPSTISEQKIRTGINCLCNMTFIHLGLSIWEMANPGYTWYKHFLLWVINCSYHVNPGLAISHMLRPYWMTFVHIGLSIQEMAKPGFTYCINSLLPLTNCFYQVKPGFAISCLVCSGLDVWMSPASPLMFIHLGLSIQETAKQQVFILHKAGESTLYLNTTYNSQHIRGHT